MPTLVLIARHRHPLAASLLQALQEAAAATSYAFSLRRPRDTLDSDVSALYIPRSTDRDGMTPDLDEAQSVFQQLRGSTSGKFILLSSAFIYGTGPSRKGMAAEDCPAGERSQPSICGQWRALEAMAEHSVGGKSLVILRPAILLQSSTLLSRRLTHRLTVTLPGRNPLVQILSVSDLARTVLSSLQHDCRGIFNVAPDGAIPLRAAIRIGGNRHFPLPASAQMQRGEALDFLRYPWTISNLKIKEKLGVAPATSNVGALLEQQPFRTTQFVPEPVFDEFGMDESYIRRRSRTIFKFLSDVYWRIDAQGLEHIPAAGGAVLVGTHRGFMPWDAVMTLHLVLRKAGRIPRFLTHPGLFKFPFIDRFVTRLGGVMACQESADRILYRGELLGIYPEGVRGAFCLHRSAYRIQPSWRNTFVKVALQHRVPIVPFVNVGSADSLPVFAHIKSRAWTRFADWPCIPVSTFPFLPVPLPSKWHVRFLPPTDLREYQPASAEDAATVKKIGFDVRRRMQESMDALVRERRSIFY